MATQLLAHFAPVVRTEPVMRILLAEDNPADVYLLREALAADGCDESIELIVVSDGEEAMDFVCRRDKYADAKTVDLVILDLNLPRSDGGDVLRCIRQNKELARTPVVILTSSDSPRDRASAERLGANCYITKPSDLDEFLALGSKLLSFARKPPASMARA